MLHDLRRQLRQQRQSPEGAAPPPLVSQTVEASEAPTSLAMEVPAELAGELHAVAELHPRLHASLAQLNAFQLRAVFSTDVSLLVRAQVGSGKTAVLVHRVLVLHLVRGVPLRQLAVLTFTRKAAGEIRSRIEALAGDDAPMRAADFWLFGTFHGVARSLLQRVLLSNGQTDGMRRDFAILDPSAREALWRGLIAAHDLDVKYPAQLAKRMDALRQGKTRHGAMKQDDDLTRLQVLATAEKLRRGVLDFDDLLDFATKLLTDKRSDSPAFTPPQHVLVDEFQDCEPRELEFLRRLRGTDSPETKGGFFAVGDPYQSIYAWRGGSPQLFDAVEREFACEALSLPVNYRSTSAILECARSVLGAQHGVTSAQGRLQGLRGAGQPVVIRRHHDAFQEAVYVRDRVQQLQAEGVPLREIAVLARTRRQLQPFSAVLADAGIACEEAARGALADRPAAAWLLQLLRAALWPEDVDAAREALLHEHFGCLTGRQWPKKALAKFPDLKGLPALARLLDKPARGLDKPSLALDFAREVVELLLQTPTVLAAPVPGCADLLWRHLEVVLLLRPTAARHEQDAQDARRLLDALETFAGRTAEGETALAGLRHALDEVAMHGAGVLGETLEVHADSVKLLTLHASKGLEFRHVFLSGINQGVVPLARTWGDLAADAEERRLLFVGLTRARDTVELGWHGRPPHPQALGLASPYLLQMPAALTEWLDGSQPLQAVQTEATTAQVQVPQQPASPYQPGVAVRHARYGAGEVTALADGTVTCRFEKFGDKAFPVLLCPLVVA